MPIDPTTDPDFMKASPGDQIQYLRASDPDFASASPQDQMGYLMHVRGGSGSQQQPSAWQVLTQPTEKTDAEYGGYTGAAGVAGATIKGLNDVARGTQGAIEGMWNTVSHPINTIRSMANLPSQAMQIPAAIHDINQSPDPLGSYANAAQDTAAQGAGQALTALGSAGIGKNVGAAAPYVAPVGKALVKGYINKLIPPGVGEAYQAVKAARVPASDQVPQGTFPATPPPELLQGNALAQGGAAPPPEPAAGLGTIPVRQMPVPTRLAYPGASLPASPPPELLQARGLTRGGTAPPPEPSDVLGQIGTSKPATAPSPSTLPNPSPQASATIPRTLSGEGALNAVLSRLDNANLIKLAKSRGISVTQEQQLKPGVANNLLINKISNDFSPDELTEFGQQYLENSRFAHQFSSQMPAEAWSTIAMKSYFPDVKIPQTVLQRTAAAMNSPIGQQGSRMLGNPPQAAKILKQFGVIPSE
jgi:hypothetical protein